MYENYSGHKRNASKASLLSTASNEASGSSDVLEGKNSPGSPPPNNRRSSVTDVTGVLAKDKEKTQNLVKQEKMDPVTAGAVTKIIRMKKKRKNDGQAYQESPSPFGNAVLEVFSEAKYQFPGSVGDNEEIVDETMSQVSSTSLEEGMNNTGYSEVLSDRDIVEAKVKFGEVIEKAGKEYKDLAQLMNDLVEQAESRPFNACQDDRDVSIYPWFCKHIKEFNTVFQNAQESLKNSKIDADGLLQIEQKLTMLRNRIEASREKCRTQVLVDKDMNWVTPNLGLGAEKCCENPLLLRVSGVDVVINLLEESEMQYYKKGDMEKVGIRVVYLPRPDKDDVYLPSSGSEYSKRWKEVVDDAVKDLREGRRYVVHCQYGTSRSVQIVIGIVMDMDGEGLPRASKKVREARKNANFPPLNASAALIRAFPKRSSSQSSLNNS